jgi:FtsH-binding integral membrane protein
MAGTPEIATKYFFSEATGTPTMLYYIVAFAPVGLGLLIQMAYRRLSMGVLLLAFLAYAALMGLSLSVILLMYSPKAVAITFFVTAGAFGAMAVIGYTTKTDLTKMGSLLYMAFIGIFIAGIVNWFVGSEMLDFIISVIGVFVFTGLTAFYMQKLKNASQDVSMSGIERNKLALVGGLILYIMFINLFLSLLRLLGND